MATQAKKARTEPALEMPRIRVSQVTLEGFKAFKEPFTLDIPPPLAKDDLDVFVIGSANGVGKTSVLDGICLALLGPPPTRAVALSDLDYSVLLNGPTRAELRCRVVDGTQTDDIWCEIHRTEGWRGDFWMRALAAGGPGARPVDRHRQAMAIATGREHDPLVAPLLLYLHSFREVAPGGLDIGTLAMGVATAKEGSVSTLKRRIFRSQIAQTDQVAGLPAAEEAQPSLDILNELVGQFAGGQIAKLGVGGDTFEVRVQLDGAAEAMPFDALSSGQKEIISTLFLIWDATRACPSVVLIDEPELHLNSGWHDDVIWMLRDLAPWNQYIIATHSQKIAGSVDADRLRVLRA